MSYHVLMVVTIIIVDPCPYPTRLSCPQLRTEESLRYALFINLYTESNENLSDLFLSNKVVF